MAQNANTEETVELTENEQLSLAIQEAIDNSGLKDKFNREVTVGKVSEKTGNIMVGTMELLPITHELSTIKGANQYVAADKAYGLSEDYDINFEDEIDWIGPKEAKSQTKATVRAVLVGAKPNAASKILVLKRTDKESNAEIVLSIEQFMAFRDLEDDVRADVIAKKGDITEEGNYKANIKRVKKTSIKKEVEQDDEE